jgi:hypothetical protein
MTPDAMKRPFEQRYADVERAYAEGHFDVARSITLELLGELESLQETPEQRHAARLWRAHLSLLLGHIQLYGFRNRGAARQAYRDVLELSEEDTHRDLAAQGLSACETLPERVTPPADEADRAGGGGGGNAAPWLETMGGTTPEGIEPLAPPEAPAWLDSGAEAAGAEEEAAEHTGRPASNAASDAGPGIAPVQVEVLGDEPGDGFDPQREPLVPETVETVPESEPMPEDPLLERGLLRVSLR